jgi:hypothetical protein
MEGVKTATWTGQAVGINRWHKPFMHGDHASIRASKEYKNFVKSLGEAFKKLDHQEEDFDLDIILTIHYMRDSDSLIKPICDALEKSGVCFDDNQIKNIEITRWSHLDGEPDQIRVILNHGENATQRKLRKMCADLPNAEIRRILEKLSLVNSLNEIIPTPALEKLIDHVRTLEWYLAPPLGESDEQSASLHSDPHQQQVFRVSPKDQQGSVV